MMAKCSFAVLTRRLPEVNMNVALVNKRGNIFVTAKCHIKPVVQARHSYFTALGTLSFIIRAVALTIFLTKLHLDGNVLITPSLIYRPVQSIRIKDVA